MTVDGTYKIEVKSPMGKQKMTITLVQDGASVSGNVADRRAVNEFSDGVVNDNEFSFEFKMKSPMGVIDSACSGKVEGDKISGITKTPLGNAPFEGVRE